MSEGLPAYLAFRVVNQNTGAEIIHDLFHLHQSSWEVRLLQKGVPGGSGLGLFSIPLPVPGTVPYMFHKSDYDLLAVGQRIEAYRGGLIAGTPWQSGIIQTLERSLTGYVIRGIDSLYALQQSKVLPDEMYRTAAPSGPNNVGQFVTGQEVQFDDTMLPANLGNYTQTPAARWTSAADPASGQNAYTCSVATSLLISTASYGSAIWGSSRVDAIFYVQAGTDATQAGEACLFVASDATGANATLGRAVFQNVGGLYTVNGELSSRAAGVDTLHAGPVALMTGMPSALRLQLTMVSYYQGSGSFWAFFVNGTFVGRWQWGNLAGNPAGRIGFRFFANAGGAPQVWVSRLRFQARAPVTSRFLVGTVGVSGLIFNNATHLNGQTDLDMLLQGATAAGFILRKNAGAGYKSDSIDCSASPGTDLSASVRFEEGVNLESLLLTGNAEDYALDLEVAGTAAVDSGGIINYPAPANVGDLVAQGTAINPGITEFGMMAQYAAQVQANASNAGAAKVATVLRDAMTADKWREGDFVTLHAPSLGIFNQTVQVVSYTLKEGETTQAVTFDQFPVTEANIPLGRLTAATRVIARTFKTR